ncbi:MAG: 6,7-dimethyl-8-ribityllumazine synthase [Actinobacteria bacterium]|nr:6,7-dimethyl-8-ribityllumazine synthase [Actinomycetota bacterium]
MSGSGAPQLKVSAVGKKVFVVATSWHTHIMDGLKLGALRELEKAGAAVEVHEVPGAFELPLAAKWAFDQGADAVIALGVVIQGETPHFDYVCDSATSGLTQVQLQYGKPIGFGLLTVDTEAQALERAGLEGSKEDKGSEAVQAALHMLSLIS